MIPLLRARRVLVTYVHLGARGLRRAAATCSRCPLGVLPERERHRAGVGSWPRGWREPRALAPGRLRAATIKVLAARFGGSMLRPAGATKAGPRHAGLDPKRLGQPRPRARGPDRPRGDARVGLRLLARRGPVVPRAVARVGVRRHLGSRLEPPFPLPRR